MAFESMAPGDDYSAQAVYIRRTGDGGTTWTSRVRVSTYGDDIAEWGTGYDTPWYTAGRPALAAYGAKVSLVFAEQYDLTPYYGVRYLGSSDGGKNWTEAGELMIDDARPVTPAVARTSTQVAVAWTDGDTGAVRVAVSSDGGDIFREAVTVGGTTSTPWSDRWDPVGIGTYTYDGEPSIAFGSSGLYVTWNVGNRIVVRRSTDGGRTWKPTVNLAWTPSTAGPTVAASGASIVVAYVTDTGAVVSRRSTDYGATWRAAQTLSSTTLDTDSLVLGRNGTSWMLAYERCLTGSCASTALFVRTSTNAGSTWSSESRVSPTYSGENDPAGIGLASGKVLVAYARHNDAESEVYVRRAN
jgi:hypothetical protein